MSLRYSSLFRIKFFSVLVLQSYTLLRFLTLLSVESSINFTILQKVYLLISIEMTEYIESHSVPICPTIYNISAMFSKCSTSWLFWPPHLSLKHCICFTGKDMRSVLLTSFLHKLFLPLRYGLNIHFPLNFYRSKGSYKLHQIDIGLFGVDGNLGYIPP